MLECVFICACALRVFCKIVPGRFFLFKFVHNLFCGECSFLLPSFELLLSHSPYNQTHKKQNRKEAENEIELYKCAAGRQLDSDPYIFL